MAKRNFAACALMAAAVAALNPAHAQDTRDAGCAALGRIVTSALYDAISQSAVGTLATQGTLLRRLPPPRTDDTAPQICGRAAAVTSLAFAKAMAGYNLSVSWSERGSSMPGNHCLGADLAQCYPQSTGSVRGGFMDRAFLLNAWQGVSAGIRQYMPYGSASDIAYFFEDELAATIAISLSATLDRPAKGTPDYPSLIGSR